MASRDVFNMEFSEVVKRLKSNSVIRGIREDLALLNDADFNNPDSALRVSDEQAGIMKRILAGIISHLDVGRFRTSAEFIMHNSKSKEEFCETMYNIIVDEQPLNTDTQRLARWLVDNVLFAVINISKNFGEVTGTIIENQIFNDLNFGQIVSIDDYARALESYNNNVTLFAEGLASVRSGVTVASRGVAVASSKIAEYTNTGIGQLQRAIQGFYEWFGQPDVAGNVEQLRVATYNGVVGNLQYVLSLVITNITKLHEIKDAALGNLSQIVNTMLIGISLRYGVSPTIKMLMASINQVMGMTLSGTTLSGAGYYTAGIFAIIMIQGLSAVYPSIEGRLTPLINRIYDIISVRGLTDQQKTAFVSWFNTFVLRMNAVQPNATDENAANAIPQLPQELQVVVYQPTLGGRRIKNKTKKTNTKTTKKAKKSNAKKSHRK